MRFHVLGLSHTRTDPSYSVCAFTQKILALCRMLHDRGHEVYHYGTAGSVPVCSEHVEVLSNETFRRVHEAYDYKAAGFLVSRDNDAWREFAQRAIAAVQRRSQPGDFLLCTFGLDHQPIAQALPHLIAVESGIGYPHTFAKYRVWESYAWMHMAYGKEGHFDNPPWYDAVIPAAFDLEDYPASPRQLKYHVFLGRPTVLKGREIAIQVCRELHIPLYVAGQGDRTVPEGVVHLGVLDATQRATCLSQAQALWAPTYYIEPFGQVAVQAQLCGTPVIATDFGAFPETVEHGIGGYRCRTYEQFVWAAQHVGDLSRAEIRCRAQARYSLARVAAMYEEYFDMLTRLYSDPAGWYTRNTGRTELNWLNR